MIEENFSKLENFINARAENSIEVTQKKYWAKIKHPFTGGFELTSKCNLKCVHCYLQDYKAEHLLSTSEIISIIDKLYEKGVLFLYFTGGEILTRNDFSEIYIYTKKKGFIVELLTNATLITQEHIDIFNEYPPANISISMYGKDENTYRKVTNTQGSFIKLITV